MSTNWFHQRLSVCGASHDVKHFIERAQGFHLIWKNGGRGPAARSPSESQLSFHRLAPLRPHTLEKYHEPGKECGHSEELRQWGCKWGAYDIQLRRFTDNHVSYDFKTPDAIPMQLLRSTSGNFPDTKFYLSYYSDDSLRGRTIVYRWEPYELTHDAPLRKGREETLKEFAKREGAWARDFYSDHYQWVKDIGECNEKLFLVNQQSEANEDSEGLEF